MTNLDTIRIIAENLKRATHISEIMVESNIYYKGEAFEYGYGARAYYSNARFLIVLTIPDNITHDEKEYVHSVRESITVDALNKENPEKQVTRAEVQKAEVAIEDGKKKINFDVLIRYREA